MQQCLLNSVFFFVGGGRRSVFSKKEILCIQWSIRSAGNNMFYVNFVNKMITNINNLQFVFRLKVALSSIKGQ
jgi:hypothetical protein